jgi:hypothetical protein
MCEFAALDGHAAKRHSVFALGGESKRQRHDGLKKFHLFLARYPPPGI